MSVASAVAHPNIAVVKYWGKRDVAANLPAVPSVSLALGPWHTRTQVRWGADADAVRFGAHPAPPAFAAKALAHLDRLFPGRPRCAVETTNDFPTGAGLASSASGFAALTVAAAAAAGLDPSPDTLSRWARLGSGSASRSIPGGWAAWWDEAARPIAPPEWWPVAMVVAVVAEGEKAVGSTAGMQRSAATSPYWPAWLSEGPALAREAEDAVRARDLERLGAAMEASTFQMHATMHTARPPLIYWQPATVAVLHAAAALRQRGVGAWVTMDAGPQVKVLCLADDAPTVAAALAPIALRTVTLLPAGGARRVP